jgi:WD40 repeat protein/transcriptional regulator with XRE-family HTH domain
MTPVQKPDISRQNEKWRAKLLNSLFDSHRMNSVKQRSMPTSSYSIDSFQTFGDLLKYLRRRQRLTQLELSIAVGYSEAQIGRLEKNQRRPDLTALKALFVPALHLENEPELVKHLLDLAESARQEDAPTAGMAPYKGLLFFNESDADLFFGRESLTAHLAEHVMDLAMDASSRFLAVVGASGSGKSSLVRAGLAVALKRVGWDTRVFTPSTNPSKMLMAALNATGVQSSERVLIVVDQFEEVFTICRDEIERIAFIERLLACAQESSKKTTVVIALRADFYSHCAQYPSLRQAVAAEQEYIGQMTAQELRRAIEEPAKRGGWEFEPGLVDILLNDVGAEGSNEPEPGALPLLSHALLATWERRRGRLFTIDAYHASGRVRGAIAETAESVFNDQLNQTQQEMARDVFLRLTELGEGTEDTRRRAALNELVRQSAEATQLRAVLNTLAEARLITLNEDSAEVAHEALIREWQRLHEWLTQDREGLLLHRHLTEAAHEWNTRGRDPAELYRGARLAQAREWAVMNEERLNDVERTFVAASIDQEQHDTLEREARRQRELEAAQKLADTEKQRAEEQAHSATQLRKRAYYLTGAFIVVLVMALAAIFFARQAQISSRLATTRELASASIRNLDVDPERSILLALQAVNNTYTIDSTVLPEAEDALRRAIQASRVELTLKGHTGPLYSAAFSPDGKRIATASADGTARIWDVNTGKELLRVKGSSYGAGSEAGHAWFVAFSPDGNLLATAGGDGVTRIWDASTGQQLISLEGHYDQVFTVAFSPDGNRLVTSSNDSTAKVWDVTTGEDLLTVREETAEEGDTVLVWWATFSPDASQIATAVTSDFEGGWTSIWDVESGQKMLTLPALGPTMRSVAFGPDGSHIVTAEDDRTAKIWDARSGKLLITLYGHTAQVTDAKYSPDGTRIATVSLDRQIKVWDAVTGQELFTLAGHSDGIWSVSFSADGEHIVTASNDGTAKVWRISPTRELLTFDNGSRPTHPNGVRLVYSPDGMLRQKNCCSNSSGIQTW